MDDIFVNDNWDWDVVLMSCFEFDWGAVDCDSVNPVRDSKIKGGGWEMSGWDEVSASKESVVPCLLTNLSLGLVDLLRFSGVAESSISTSPFLHVVDSIGIPKENLSIWWTRHVRKSWDSTEQTGSKSGKMWSHWHGSLINIPSSDSWVQSRDEDCTRWELSWTRW